MAKDFEQMGYKNLELLRFYLSKDINKIDKKIQKNDNELRGFFIASLVDFLIVIICNQYLERLCFVLKIVSIVGLIVLFLVLSSAISAYVLYRREKRAEAGRDKYLSEKVLEKVDDFDNIACDGLLICAHYIQKYSKDNPQYINDFYLFEIIHHLKKITDIFRGIYSEQNIYISDQNRELLDPYRINNFIIFAQNINVFLQNELTNKTEDSTGDTIDNRTQKALNIDLQNLNNTISGWKLI